MTAQNKTRVFGGETESRRSQIMYGDGYALEPEDEPLDAISNRLAGRPAVPAAPDVQSVFIRTFLQKFSSDLRRMADSTVIEAEVIECKGDAPVTLDLSTGTGFLDESESRPDDLRPGSRIFVSPVDSQRSVYSVRLARGRRSLSVIESLWAGGVSVEGILADHWAGQGWTVDLDGFWAALPDEEVGDLPVKSHMALKLLILHYDPQNFCVILSRKKFQETARKMTARQAVARLRPGQIVAGRVVSVSSAGARVDLGGMIADLSGEDAGFGPPRDNLSALQIGQPIRVFVLEVTADRIIVGVRQLYPDPWVFVKKSLQPGTQVSATVREIGLDRVKVELSEGVTGEIPWKEAGWQIEDPSELGHYFSAGAVVEAICLSVERDASRVVLSLKSLRPDPLPEIQRRYAVGFRCEVALVSAQAEKARVVTDDGFHGIISPDDLSWSGPVSPLQFFSGRPSAGAVRRIFVEVLSVDPTLRLIRFGVKQVRPDPFLVLSREIEVGKTYDGRVVKIIAVGALVEIRKGLVGLLRKSDYAESEPAPAEGQTLKVAVMNIQPQQHRMTLSRRAVVEIEERRDMQPFLSAPQEERKVRMKDILPGDVFKRFFEKKQ